MPNKTEIAENNLSRQLAWVSSADSKIPPLFAINAGMLGVLAALISPISQWTIVGAILISLAIILLLGSTICIAIAAFPRISGPKDSIIYFSTIVARSESSFIKAFNEANDDEVTNDLLKQVYRNAEIAKSKYTFIKWAYIQTFVSFPFWIFSIFYLHNL